MIQGVSSQNTQYFRVNVNNNQKIGTIKQIKKNLSLLKKDEPKKQLEIEKIPLFDNINKEHPVIFDYFGKKKEEIFSIKENELQKHYSKSISKNAGKLSIYPIKVREKKESKSSQKQIDSYLMSKETLKFFNAIVSQVQWKNFLHIPKEYEAPGYENTIGGRKKHITTTKIFNNYNKFKYGNLHEIRYHFKTLLINTLVYYGPQGPRPVSFLLENTKILNTLFNYETTIENGGNKQGAFLSTSSNISGLLKR
jgi:hypothetical protein